MHLKRRGEEPIRILVADDTRIHTQLIAEVLRKDAHLEVFHSSPEEVATSSAAREIDVLIISARLDEDPTGGVDILRKVRKQLPQVRGVVLLDSSKREVILSAFRAGAQGLFSRDTPIESLADCVRQVHAGKVWATAEQMNMALQALEGSPTVRAVNANGLSLLSKRELDVVTSLAEGLSNREIAERLGLSQHTVKNYLFRVFDKLGVSSRIELLFLTLNRNAADLVPQDESKARHGSDLTAVQRGAVEGLPKAQMAFAAIHAEGKIVEQNLCSAYMWYLICEKNILEMKDAISAEKRKIAELLTTEEILEAQKLASEGHKKPARGVAGSPSETAAV